MTESENGEGEGPCVLHFSGDALKGENCYSAAALEIYRHVRRGETVVAMVSAPLTEVERLRGQAERVGGGASSPSLGRLAEVGALHSAALMTLALDRIGVLAASGALDGNSTSFGHPDCDVLVIPRRDANVRIQPLDAPSRRLRVALLGSGSVGGGVLSYLKARPDLFDLNPVLVRDPARRGPGFTNDLEKAMENKPDILVETLGGADFPAEIMCAALRLGCHVVTANKAAVAKHYDALHACARAGGASLACSGSVGGGTPVLEALDRLAGGVVAVEGVMNGTCNFLLGKLSEGSSFDAVVAEAQALGFAEADPAADVDGHDAADKLSLIVRRAFGVALPPDRIRKQSLRDVTRQAIDAARERGQVLKQIGRCQLLSDGTVAAEVRIHSLPAAHALAAVRNEENRFLIRDVGGGLHDVHGKGAGRWPTAAAVFADVMDLRAALQTRLAADEAPALLRA